MMTALTHKMSSRAFRQGLVLASMCAFAAAFVPTSYLGKQLRLTDRMKRHATPMKKIEQLRPPLPRDFYVESLLDRVALSLFRGLVQKEIGFISSKPGYDGLIEEARYYQLQPGVTGEDQQRMVRKVLEIIAGPAVPPVYGLFMAPWFWAPFLTAFFTPPFFKFLVGPNRLDARSDGTAGGVYVERCRFLEETKCKGLCLNMCKLPTQQFFKETLGLPMAMEPNFDTYECRLSFGLEPKPLEEDPDVPKGCLEGCSAVSALQEGRMDRRVVCGK